MKFPIPQFHETHPECLWKLDLWIEKSCRQLFGHNCQYEEQLQNPSLSTMSESWPSLGDNHIDTKLMWSEISLL